MEVAAPTKPMDFDFTSSSYYSSAPSSPTRLSDFYCEFDELLIAACANRTTSLATVPFAWEEKPGVPKGAVTNLFEDDFSFDVSCQFGKDSVPAEDLFHGGVIKPLGRQPGVQEKRGERERGRERVSSSSGNLPSSRSRRTRSLSPLGGSDHRREQQQQRQPMSTYTMPPSSSTSSTPSAFENGSKKWSFIDLLLFRSASDGRAMDRDPLKKYSATFRKHDQDIRNSTGSMSKRRGRVSAHELHYTVNRAVSNDMKKKTYLPYKQGILGRFSFNPKGDLQS